MEPASGIQRLFFAFWPDEPTRQAIHKQTRKVVRHSGGKPITPENFHITLVFLGNMDAQNALLARKAADSVVSEPFTLTLDRLYFWPEPRVLTLAPSQVPDVAQDLTSSLLTALRVHDLVSDVKPFEPHVTLARKASHLAVRQIHSVHWQIEDFVLVRSVTHQKGSEYTPIARWTLMR